MTETYMRLDGQDGFGIWGRLCAGGNRRLVVHIHGLTHQMNYLLEVTSSEFFEENGYDHYRIGLYDRAPDSRRLPQSTLATHTKDIQTVIDHFRTKYDEIYITAHSLGALAVLILNPTGVKAISLWDPSLDVTVFWNTGTYLTYMPEYRQYKLDYGNVFVLSEDMVEEIKKYPDAKCLELAAQVTVPTQFIIPDESIFLASPQTSPEKYRDAYKAPFDLQRIKTANHVFSYRGNRQALFQASLDWFRKW
ncbi:MAG: hypothetical protein WCD70_07950 [Alphaproteobacteria bacterium]